MVGRDSFRPSPEMCFAVGDSKHFVPAQPSPRQNHLLAALPQQECQRLVPDLEPCPLPLGWTIHDAGDRERYLYFITAGIVSRFYVTAGVFTMNSRAKSVLELELQPVPSVGGFAASNRAD